MKSLHFHCDRSNMGRVDQKLNTNPKKENKDHTEINFQKESAIRSF
jgi:hypothetical protein